MERDEVVGLIARAAAAIGDEMRQRIEEGLKASHARLESSLSASLAARLLIVDQLLAEKEARAANAMAVNDARFAGLIAYVQGQDPQAAFDRQREVFRDAHAGVFDPEAWGTEPDWLSALRKATG